MSDKSRVLPPNSVSRSASHRRGSATVSSRRRCPRSAPVASSTGRRSPVSGGRVRRWGWLPAGVQRRATMTRYNDPVARRPGCRWGSHCRQASRLTGPTRPQAGAIRAALDVHEDLIISRGRLDGVPEQGEGQGLTGLPGVVAGQANQPVEVGADLLPGLRSRGEERRGGLPIGNRRPSSASTRPITRDRRGRSRRG